MSPTTIPNLSDGLLLLVVVVTLLAFNGADAAAAAAASASSLHSSLDVPSRSLSRHRRFITPKSSGWRFSFRVSFSLTIPLLGPTNGNGRLSASAPFAFNYALDDGFGLLTSGRKRRAVLLDDPKEEFAENERERYEMIGHMERLLSAHVDEAEGDGHACMLKALCQVAQTPLHGDGFFGDAMNTILAPDYLSDLIHSIDNPNEYLVAHKDGMVHDDCAAYEGRCKLNLFEFDPIESPDDLDISEERFAFKTGNPHYGELDDECDDGWQDADARWGGLLHAAEGLSTYL